MAQVCVVLVKPISSSPFASTVGLMLYCRSTMWCLLSHQTLGDIRRVAASIFIMGPYNNFRLLNPLSV